MPKDPDKARRLIEQATRHLQSASVEQIDRDTRYSAAYLSMIKCMNAVLLFHGQRVTGGSTTHIVLINTAQQHFPKEQASLFGRVDDTRRARNQMSYDGDEVTETELTMAISDAKELLELVKSSG